MTEKRTTDQKDGSTGIVGPIRKAPSNSTHLPLWGEWVSQLARWRP